MAQAVGQSKNAKRRAAKKANAAATAAVEEEVAPVSAPVAQPKSKAQAKAKGKAQAAPQVPVEPPKPKEELLAPNVTLDDGSGGAWESVTSTSQKKKGKLMEKKAMAAAYAATRGVVGAADPSFKPVVGAADPVVSQFVGATAQALAAAKAEAEVTATRGCTVTVDVPEKKVGMVIGPKGATLNTIKEKTGVARIDTQENGGGVGIMTFTISGPKEDGVSIAAHAIRELVEKGVMSLAFDNFGEERVMVHPSYLPDLIGKQGVVIQKIKKELGVELTMPACDAKAAAGKKKYPVKLAGDAAKVATAKEVINSICNYYCHPITHPGQTYGEIEVPEYQRSFIIGKGGCELRHIQNCFKVRMYIPREHSENANVVVVGEPDLVKRAIMYIERTLAGGGGEDAAPADDGMGEDETEEAWMTDYIYKRH